jgi:PAS domain S-box-containing protein
MGSNNLTGPNEVEILLDTGKPLRILILEDRPADAEAAAHELRKAGLEFVAKKVTTENEFLTELRHFPPQLILADYSLPAYDGLSALAAAQKHCPEAPFIFVSGSLGEERAIETLHRGATDYVLKERLARLGPAVRRALREREEMRKGGQAETQQRKNEEQFLTMFDEASVGMAQADLRTGQWLRVNQKMCAITGYSAAELLRMRVPELMHPDDRQRDWEKFQRVVRGEASDYRLEKRYVRKDGTVAWVNVNMTVIRDAAGQPVRTMATIEDITERKQAEQRIRELNLLLRATGTVNALIVRERDPKQLLAETCQILVETRGYRFAWIGQVEAGSKRVVPQARAGKDTGYLDSLTITWDEAPTGRGPIGTAIRTGQLVACQDTATDPRLAPWREEVMARGIASLAAIPMIHGSRVLGVVAVYSERTGAFDTEELDLLKELVSDLAFALQGIEHEQERTRAEEALFESERRYRLLFNSGYDAVVVHEASDAQGRPGKFLEVNDVACQRWGYTREELLQMSPFDLHTPESARAIPGIVRRLAKEKRAVWEAVKVAKDGRQLPVEISSQLFELNGKPAYLSTIRDITERERAQAHLHLLREALESAANAIVITDRDGIITWANAAFTTLSGYPLEEALGRKMSLLKSGKHDQAFYEQLWKTILSGRMWSEEMINRRKDGSLYSEENTITPVRNEQGEITHCIAVKQDVTERKRAELRIEAFSRLGQRLSAARTAREAAGIISEVAGELLGWDACSFSLLSPSRELLDDVLQVDTVEGRRVEYSPGSQLPSEMARRTIEAGGQLILKEKPDEMLPGGQPFGNLARPSASIMYVPVRKGAEVVGLMSIRSYTAGAYDQRSLETLQALAELCGGALDRLRMEEAWQTSQQQLGHLLAQSPAVIYSLKTDGKTTEPVWVSDNVEQLLGYTVAECHGPEGLFNQVHPQDCRAGMDGLVQLFANKHVARDCRVRHKSGEYRWVRDEQRLVCDAAGAPVEIVGSWMDITEQKALEERLRQSQKMEAVGQLAGGVAHDFNNMLAVIRGNAELLLLDAAHHTAETKECLKHVVDASERAANLTRQLLAFSRKQVLLPQPLALNDVIADLTKMLKRVIGENIDLQRHYAAPLPYVQADLGMMEQVILNLVVNSRDAMPGGGRLRIATEHLRLDEGHTRANLEARAGEFVCLLVSDTGTGIAPEVLPRIFEPFFTTKEVGQGTGLGLATVYGIVKQHQGWIEVSSRAGEGTTFKVFIPCIPPPAQRTATSEASREARGGTETILLVEDDDAVRLTTRRVLESKGYKVHEATCGREALELWHRHAGEIALLVTDIIMPEEMTGRDLADQLWRQRPGLKVIFMSGYSADVMGKNTEFIRRTKSHFLQKPCSSRALLETVRQCLDESEPLAAPKEGGSEK